MSPEFHASAVRHLWRHARTVTLTATAVGGIVVSARILRTVLAAIVHNISAVTWEGSFPSMATIAERAECSVSTARRAVRALEAAGILVTEAGGGRKSNRYRLVRPVGDEHQDDTTPSTDRGARSSRPTTPQPLPQRAKSGLRARVHARAAQTNRPPRSTTIPEDLRPLADALVGRGLRAAYGLTKAQADDVRAVMARVGVPAMVAAAYRAHRANDPARFWSAWVGMWNGLHEPCERPAAPSPVVSAPVDAGGAERTMSGAAAARAAIAAARRQAVAA